MVVRGAWIINKSPKTSADNLRITKPNGVLGLLTPSRQEDLSRQIYSIPATRGYLAMPRRRIPDGYIQSRFSKHSHAVTPTEHSGPILIIPRHQTVRSRITEIESEDLGCLGNFGGWVEVRVCRCTHARTCFRFDRLRSRSAYSRIAGSLSKGNVCVC